MLSRQLAYCLIALQLSFSQFAAATACESTQSTPQISRSSSKYFAELLQSGVSAPLEDFLVLWNSQRLANLKQPDLIKCTKIESVCSIDTVYSWGSREKLSSIQASMPDGGKWVGAPNGTRSIYALFSAVGSYGYGEIPVRIKLRPNAFEVFPNWEVKLTDSSVVESWSYGTAEQYDEIVRDLRRYLSGKEWFGYTATQEVPKVSRDRLFFDGLLDNRQFTEESLKSSLLTLIKMILNEEGNVYFSAGSCRSREVHFSTSYPTYIDPFQSLGSKPSWRKSWMAP